MADQVIIINGEEANIQIGSTIPTDEIIVVSSDDESNPISDTIPKKSNDDVNLYSTLLEMEQWAVVPNKEAFECDVCMLQCEPYDGVVLRDCLHSFCRECLAYAVSHCVEPTVACLATGCSGSLQEREIRALVSPEEYERLLARSLKAAESSLQNTFHCRTPDCKGWAVVEPGTLQFLCPVCQHSSCLSCLAIHEGLTCNQHQSMLNDNTDTGTKALLENLIASGEALKCPECKATITKASGCDWIMCSSCKTEICWVTRGRRWGPRGQGDTSGGCKCRLYRNKLCHPSCRNCH